MKMKKEKANKTTVSFQIDKELYDNFKKLLFLVEGREKVTTYLCQTIEDYVSSHKELLDVLKKALDKENKWKKLILYLHNGKDLERLTVVYYSGKHSYVLVQRFHSRERVQALIWSFMNPNKAY